MRVYVYPSDRGGCGYFRMIWPAEALVAQGHNVKIVYPDQRWDVGVKLHPRTGEVLDAFCPEDADVIVLQRITHQYMARAVELYRKRGVAVVIDIDDDLTAIDPRNPASVPLSDKHNWNNLKTAAKHASLVTVSSTALMTRYGAHGRTRYLPNYLPDHYFGIDRIDSPVVGWPASLHSHPGDPAAVGGALNRLDTEVQLLGRTKLDVAAYRRAFNLRRDPQLIKPVDPEDWPKLVASLGVGIAPLADTKFNAAKSWLKPMELAACGVPWVGSPRAEYVKFRDQTGVGWLAKNPAQWYRHLNELVRHEQLRVEESAKGRAAAEAYRITDHAWRWAEAWSDAARSR